MKKWCLLFIVVMCCLETGFSQISPPGLGEGKTADWFALGFRKKLKITDESNWLWLSYVGIGRKSNPEAVNPFFKQAIWVLNQEFYYLHRNKMQYSFALSYRHQDEYKKQWPYEHDLPAYKQEFRVYGRVSYIFATSRWRFIPTFRQEIRRFYAPDFRNMSEEVQLRSRFRLQCVLQLDAENRHRILANSEQLFSVSTLKNNLLTEFAYRESRFSLCYCIAPKQTPVVVSLGYMNNMVGINKEMYNVHYLAMDVVLELDKL